LDTLESRSQIPGKFPQVVLEKDGNDQLDGSCGKIRRNTQSQGSKENPTYHNTEAGKRIYHILVGLVWFGLVWFA
jgi:hypothetical protein